MVLPGGKHGREGGGGRGPDPRRHLSSIKLCKRRYPSRVGGGGGGIAVYAPSRNGRIFGVQMVQGGREREGRRSTNRQTAKSLNRVSIALLDLDLRDTEGEGVGSMVRREFGKFAGKSVIFLSRDLSLTD